MIKIGIRKNVIITLACVTVIILFIFYQFQKREFIDSRNNIETLIDKKILFPDSSYIITEDDLLEKVRLIVDDKITFVTRISGECHSCISLLTKWEEELIPLLDTNEVQFVFFIYSSNIPYLIKSILSETSFGFPFYIDQEDTFIQLNDLYQFDYKFHSLLLNPQRQVILVGNPIFNPKLKKIFIKRISEFNSIIKHIP